MSDGIADIPFAEPARAEASLDAIFEEAPPELRASLLDALRVCGDPDTTLTRLERYLEACISAHTTLALMAGARRHLDMAITLLSQSHYLTDVVCRNPEYMLWLREEGALETTPARSVLREELLAEVRAAASFDARCKVLRRFHRRQILRIAARDLCVHAPLRAVTEDLSNLADAVLAAALESGETDLAAQFGNPQCRDGDGEASFAVLALGKLGGRELNFSSDIDLLMVYSAEGQTSGGASGSLANVEYFHKLTERIIKGISEQTVEGRVFRVDMRLRPHGRVGPLAISLDAAMEYYERSGEAWERQALIKTRPAAGDEDLGQLFIERARPFVYPRYFDDDTLEDILDVKRQTEAMTARRGTSGRSVKMGLGGIRDIEFTVQILQLLNGGRMEDLRTPNTLDALDVLGRHNLLRPFEATELASTYVFLRQAEHRLQIEGSQQRHELPSQPEALDRFARRLGYPSGPSLMAEYAERTEGIRRILDQFVTNKGGGHLWVAGLVNESYDAANGLARLAAMGFKDPEKARQELIHLYAGTDRRPHTLHVRQQFLAVAPALLEAVAKCPDPDDGLLRLGGVLSSLRAPGALYDLLDAYPQLSENLVILVSNSDFLGQFIVRDPGLFDLFGAQEVMRETPSREELEQRLDGLLNAYDPEAAVYRFHDGETLRIGMRDLFGHADVVEVGRELAMVADVCLAYALARAQEDTRRRFGDMPLHFAVLGLGKLGGRELGYGSDLDLVFVHEDLGAKSASMSPVEYFSAQAAHLIRTLKERTRYGTLYDVDARLRPDGNKGVLVVSAKRFEGYYAEEAQAWERLALVKVRAVAGDAAFAGRLVERAHALAFGRPLSQADLDHIDELRHKTATGVSELDLKKTEGGLFELEFLVRILQIQHGADAPSLRCPDVVGAAKALGELGILSGADIDALLDAYALFRRIENRIRMMHGRTGSVLPEDPAQREGLARRLGLTGDLAEMVRERQAWTHARYLAVLQNAATA